MDRGIRFLRTPAVARHHGWRYVAWPAGASVLASTVRRFAGSVTAGIFVVLLAWAVALPGPVWPVLPAHVETIRPVELQARRGTALAMDGGTLKVWSADAGSALQVRDALGLDAQTLDVLRYGATGFPSTLELVLVWRRADAPGTVHSVTLPAPGNGTRAFELSQSPEWRGTIVEIGLAQFPVPLLADAASAFRPFEIDTLRLESASLASGARAFVDQLSAWRPWTQRSINSLGRELGHGEGMTLVTLVVPLLAFAVWLYACRPAFARRRAAAHVLAGACALTWLVADGAWHLQLLRHNDLARATAATGGVADAPLAASAASVREWLSRHRRDAKVAVLASSSFLRTRLAYHLRPADVSPEHGSLFLTGDAPGRAILLVHDSLQTSFRDGVLSWPDGELAGVRELGNHGPLRLFETRR
jgi:hypothetical protein